MYYIICVFIGFILGLYTYAVYLDNPETVNNIKLKDKRRFRIFNRKL